jgi:hypothetical protein
MLSPMIYLPCLFTLPLDLCIIFATVEDGKIAYAQDNL